jgi:hypothetical protein
MRSSARTVSLPSDLDAAAQRPSAAIAAPSVTIAPLTHVRHAASKGRAAVSATAPRNAMSSTARRSAPSATAAVAVCRPSASTDHDEGDAALADAFLLDEEEAVSGDVPREAADEPRRTSPVGARDFGDGDARDGALQEQLRADLQLRVNAYLTRGRARVVLTNNAHTMLSVKRAHDMWTIRIHHMFASAPPVVVRAIARYCELHCPESSRILRAFVDAQDHLIAPTRGRREVAMDTQGRHHDLRALFDDLNEHYFAGQVQARITWGPRTKRRRGRESIKLGSYTIEDEIIRIHPVLDVADVPEFFVAYIVYHEMLHELHEMPIVDGRRIYHTAEFRRDEARFEAYAEALEWERLHVRELLDR